MNITAERSYPTPMATSPLLPFLLLSLASQRNAPKTKTIDDIDEEYDFIIVGAGSAGSVVASRLSEMPCLRILLLEAGKAAPMLTDVPGYARSFWLTDLDWQYRTTPQKHTGRQLRNRQVVWPSGKALGGSSIINAMLYVRGNKKNYNDWAAQGATGWSYPDVLPYFKKMEDNLNPEFVMDGFHGIGGPVAVEQLGYHAEIFKDQLLKAVQELGYNTIDSNAERQTGFYDHQANVRNQQRCSTAKAYLVPAENRTNLDILENAFVRKVIFNKKRAVGVIFDHGNQTYQVKARRQVIISAGTTNTAQLLMLSGIGPRKTLNKYQIPLVKNLPVGRNMQDHCSAMLNFDLDPYFETSFEKFTSNQTTKQYIYNRTGIMASTEAVSLLAFLRGLTKNDSIDDPRYQLYIFEAYPLHGKPQFGVNTETDEKLYKPYVNKPVYGCFSSILQPESRGYVTINSADPYDPPVINPNYMAKEIDIRNVVDGLAMCLKLANTAAMRSIGSKPNSARMPGCEQYPGFGRRYLRCVVESVVVTMSHQVGTARMGDIRNRTTVVGPRLRVKGVRGLRVVDASVMPKIPSGNTNIPTIMLAEKASDLIKEEITC